jgi:serine protease
MSYDHCDPDYKNPVYSPPRKRPSLPYVVVQFSDRFVKENELPYDDGQQERLTKVLVGLIGNYPGVRLRPLFRAAPAEKLQAFLTAIRQRDEAYAAKSPNFLAFYQVVGPLRTDFAEIARLLGGKGDAIVLKAYVERPLPPPQVDFASQPRFGEQFHLQPALAPGALGGIGAVVAWGHPGGDGHGVNFVDLERGWQRDHEDLPQTIAAPPLPGLNDPESQGHGTAVLGILCGKDHSDGTETGGVGIAPRAQGYVFSCFEGYDDEDAEQINHETAIEAATLLLWELRNRTHPVGDILLLEAQIADPRGSGLKVPLEASFGNLVMIEAATAAGIIVVEAGGNGKGTNLSFDADAWVAPDPPEDTGTHRLARRIGGAANPAFRDSGAILVSAAELAGAIRPMAYAPLGSRVDCFAWGWGITTCWSIGTAARDVYAADLMGRNPKAFGGTSAAAAIVAGAAILLQSIARAQQKPVLTPRQMRAALSTLAWNTPPGVDPATASFYPIGAMPDLGGLIPRLSNGELHLLPA